ncbi:MAG: YjbH domain-containing protein, partial [Pseudomonadota bacterium]
MSRRLGAAALVAVLPFAVLPFAVLPSAAWAQEPPAPRPETFNLYGMTGLIDTPTARTQPDGQLTFTSSVFSEFNRNTLHFQVLPRLEGAFRYSIIEDFFRSGEDLFDRSFDLKLRVVDESRYLPSIAVGVQDFLGTGVLSAEYVVGTKSLGYGLTATGGLGWGRLSEAGTFRNPFCQAAGRFCEREADGDAGTVDIGRYFSGEDMAVFGGLEWRPAALPGLSLMAEYSPDEYRRDRRFNSFERDIPFNFGVDYRFNEHFSLGAYAMYGSAVGLRASLGANPSRPLAPPTGADGPPPLIPRAPVLAGPPPELG